MVDHRILNIVPYAIQSELFVIHSMYCIELQFYVLHSMFASADLKLPIHFSHIPTREPFEVMYLDWGGGYRDIHVCP